MSLKSISFVAFAFSILAACYLYLEGHIFSLHPVMICIQVIAFSLMIWARLTLGQRSFNATANTTPGGLVTNGPYKLLRHPIYAAAIWFMSATLIAYHDWKTIIAWCFIVTGLMVRILLEEKILMETFPEYAAYSKKTKRIIPFVY